MIANRVKNISSFLVMDILERAHQMERSGVPVIHLEVGEPDFDTPRCIKDAVCKALENGFTNYTHSLGMMDLREAICEHYLSTYHVSLDPDQVIVCSGTSPAMLAVFSVLVNAGDEVIISDPHYACYPNFVKFVGGEPVAVKVDEDDGFQYRPEEIEKKIGKKTKAIVINSPANPTGNVLSEERMQAIAQLPTYIISDEIYHGLVYEGEARSILEFTDNAFVFNGFSKRYAMTGLRLGYLITPKPFIRSIQKLQQNFFISANSIIQAAGIAALKQAGAEVEEMRQTYNKRRVYMVERLKALGFGITVAPTGAFYVFANVKHISTDSLSLAFDLLEKARVGVAPGIDFGKNGEGYLRFSYANSMENIALAMDRIKDYLDKR